MAKSIPRLSQIFMILSKCAPVTSNFVKKKSEEILFFQFFGGRTGGLKNTHCNYKVDHRRKSCVKTQLVFH